MHISKEGLKLIKKWEGCHLSAYTDCVGVWTIGWGVTNADRKITGTKIRSGLKITQATADAWLEDCIRELYEPKVNKYMEKYGWTQNEYDALVSFCYNIGNIDGLTANGSRNKETIAKKILEYCKAGGRRAKGLYDRRVDEYNMFCGIKKVEDYDMPTLKVGSKGKAVKVWQLILEIDQTGIFDDKTLEATKAFQKKKKLTVDGIVGRMSWSAGLGTL